jgi:hypothetical protein
LTADISPTMPRARRVRHCFAIAAAFLPLLCAAQTPPLVARVRTGKELQAAARNQARHIVIEQHMDLSTEAFRPNIPYSPNAVQTAGVLETTASVWSIRVRVHRSSRPAECTAPAPPATAACCLLGSRVTLSSLPDEFSSHTMIPAPAAVYCTVPLQRKGSLVRALMIMSLIGRPDRRGPSHTGQLH